MRRAFTLVEMVIVLIILSIVTAIAVPRLHRSLSYHRAEAAARRIKLDFEFARRRAKTTGQSQPMQFDIAQQSYTLPGLPDLDRKLSAYVVTLSKTPYEVQLVDVNLGGQMSTTFNGFGIPSHTGTVTVQAGPYQRIITLEAHGSISIQ